MRGSLRSIGLVLCLALPLTSCATSEQTNQLLGGMAGAATGAGIGALAGGGTKGILAGAAAGAVVGWGVVKLAQYHAEQTASAKDEARAYGYRESEGTVVKMRGARVQPDQIHAGDRATFDMDYSVLAPKGAERVDVVERWNLSKDGKTVTEMPAQTVRRDPGGWRSKASVDIPSNADHGTYVVKSRVEAGTSYDERVSTFVVR